MKSWSKLSLGTQFLISALIVSCAVLTPTILLQTQPVGNLGYSRQSEVVMDAVTTSTIGNAIFTGDFRNIVCDIDAVSTTATLKFAGSIAEIPPVPTSTKSVTNSFEDIQVVDKEDGSVIDGDTGVSIAGTDHRMVVLNSDLLSWVVPYTSSFTTSTGGLTVLCRVGDNE